MKTPSPRWNLLVVMVFGLGALTASCESTHRSSSVSTDATAESPDRSALAEELIAMSRADQEMRTRLLAWMKEHRGDRSPPPEMAKEMIALDRKNAARVKQIIDDIGWPTSTRVGIEAAGAAWLIIQHAVHDLPLMQHALELMKPYFHTGEIDDHDYALLYDRVNDQLGRPQYYGSQGTELTIDGVRHFGAVPIEDVAHVDERRAAIGLMPLREYLQVLREMSGIPDDVPEIPLSMTRAQYDALVAKMRATRN